MPVVTLADAIDLSGFRTAARDLVRRGVPPPHVVWRVAGSDAGDLPGLDGPVQAPAEPAVPGVIVPDLRVPRRFLALAEAVVCHSDPARFALLYRLLWRLKVEPRLMEVATDPDVAAALRMEKAVGRAVHKMHAFVRFRRVGTAEGEVYVAWFEPPHFVEERAASFFADRFAATRWTIVTPRVTVAWDGAALAFGPGGRRADLPAADASEDLWRAYYAAIFNPARLKVKAMTAEMPKRYWRNLPEAGLIADLIAGAEARARDMVAAAPTAPPPRHERLRARTAAMPDPDFAEGTLAAVRAEAAACRRCDLWRSATQTVFGEGPETADAMFVGEQPGDREDLAGRPFVGPAGQVFDAALSEAGIVRDRIYVTNAVKHFKYEPRGKRRLHKRPDGAEIQACRWWLARELALVAPRLVVGLGGTALQALLDRPVKVGDLRGRFLEFGNAPPVFATIHPSAILRMPDPVRRAEERARFVEDLARVAAHLRTA